MNTHKPVRKQLMLPTPKLCENLMPSARAAAAMKPVFMWSSNTSTFSLNILAHSGSASMFLARLESPSAIVNQSYGCSMCVPQMHSMNWSNIIMGVYTVFLLLCISSQYNGSEWSQGLTRLLQVASPLYLDQRSVMTYLVSLVYWDRETGQVSFYYYFKFLSQLSINKI